MGDYYLARLGMRRYELGDGPAQWFQDMVTIDGIVRANDQAAMFRFLAALMGAKTH